MKKLNIIVLVLSVLPLISLMAIQGRSSVTLPSIVTNSKLTGAHASFECTTCHVDPHKPEVNVTICSTCHSGIWDMVQAGYHEGGSAPFDDYCVTCHDPHHPEYLWNLTKQDWILLNATAPEINDLCYQCHAFSPEEFDVITDSHNPLRIMKPPFSLMSVFFVVIIALPLIALVASVATSKLAKIKLKPKLPH